MKQFITATKPFLAVGAKVPKPLPRRFPPTARQTRRASQQGVAMFKLDCFRLNSRKAIAFGALAIGTLALSGAAFAAPLPLFPFIIPPPFQAPEQQPQAAPEEN